MPDNKFFLQTSPWCYFCGRTVRPISIISRFKLWLSTTRTFVAPEWPPTREKEKHCVFAESDNLEATCQRSGGLTETCSRCRRTLPVRPSKAVRTYEPRLFCMCTQLLSRRGEIRVARRSMTRNRQQGNRARSKKVAVRPARMAAQDPGRNGSKLPQINQDCPCCKRLGCGRLKRA